MLDQSQCLCGCSTENNCRHSCYEWNTSHPMSTQAIYSLQYPTQALYWLHYPASCLISSHTSSQLLVTTNWAGMHNFLHLKHRCPATSHIPWHALYNWILLVNAVASYCTELLQLTSYNKTPVIQSVASQCIKLFGLNFQN